MKCTIQGRMEMKNSRIDRTCAGLELQNAWNNREHILSDPEQYERTPEWTRSGCQFFSIWMPIGLILECWMDGGAFILPDDRRIFSFSGSALSGCCNGWAVDLRTGEVSAFESKKGNNVIFHTLLWARNRVLSERKDASKNQ